MKDAEATAFHEVGHAWAYARASLPLRYVTIRPREAGLAGVCRPWRPRRIDIAVGAWIASSGPIAEAMWMVANAGPGDDWLDWDDYVTGAVLAGGHDDLAKSFGMLDSPESVDRIRSELDAAWPSLARAAEMLVERGTVSGRELFALLA